MPLDPLWWCLYWVIFIYSLSAFQRRRFWDSFQKLMTELKIHFEWIFTFFLCISSRWLTRWFRPSSHRRLVFVSAALTHRWSITTFQSVRDMMAFIIMSSSMSPRKIRIVEENLKSCGVSVVGCMKCPCSIKLEDVTLFTIEYQWIMISDVLALEWLNSSYGQILITLNKKMYYSTLHFPNNILESI